MRSMPLVILMSILIAACGHRPDARGVARDETLVQVSATGKAQTRPDEARFSAGVTSRGATAAVASGENNKEMTRVVAAIAAAGVAEQDIKTQTVGLSRIDYGRDRGSFIANNVVEVRVRRVDAASKVIGAATAAGANVLSGPDLRVSDQQAANLTAYAAAYTAARARADAYAGAAGMKITRVLAIRDGGDTGGPQPDQDRMMSQAMAPPPVVAPPPVRVGMQDSQVAVRVDFVARQK